MYTLPCVQYIASEKLLFNQELSLVLCDHLDVGGGVGVWGLEGRLKEERMYVYL